MTSPRYDVRPGQPLALAAEQVNWINAQMRGSTAFGSPSIEFPQAPYTALPLRNTSSQVLPRWEGVEITGLQVEPSPGDSAGTDQFQRTPVLRGGLLTAAAPAWGVAIEPIKANEYGMVAIAGVVQCKLRIASAADRGVMAEAGGLATASSGEGGVLWKEPATGNGKWALISLGNGGGGNLVGIIRYTGPWALNATKTVTMDGTTDTLSALNVFVDIAGTCGERLGAVIRYRSTWYLIAAQFH